MSETVVIGSAGPVSAMAVDASRAAESPNWWAILSSICAALVLPVWGFFALSTLTWQNPLEGGASYNLLTGGAIQFIRLWSLELGISIVALTAVPILLFAVAVFFRVTERRPRTDTALKVAIVLNSAIVVLFLAAILPVISGYSGG